MQLFSFFWFNGEIDKVLASSERVGRAIRNVYDRRNGLTINTQEDMDIWSTKKSFRWKWILAAHCLVACRSWAMGALHSKNRRLIW